MASDRFSVWNNEILHQAKKAYLEWYPSCDWDKLEVGARASWYVYAGMKRGLIPQAPQDLIMTMDIPVWSNERLLQEAESLRCEDTHVQHDLFPQEAVLMPLDKIEPKLQVVWVCRAFMKHADLYKYNSTRYYKDEMATAYWVEPFPVGTRVTDVMGDFKGVGTVQHIDESDPRHRYYTIKLDFPTYSGRSSVKVRGKRLHKYEGPDPRSTVKEETVTDQSPPVLDSAPFYGAVSLVEFHQDLDGQQYRCFVGAVQIVEAKAYLGFATGASEANWMAVVSGDKTTLVFPGCKITHVTEIKGDHLSQTFVSRATAVKVVE